MKLFKNILPSKVIFFDIETVTSVRSLFMLPKRMQDEWIRMSKKNNPAADPSITFRNEGAFHAEFSRVVCISVGGLTPEGEFKTHSFTGEDSEQEMLTSFGKFLNERKEKKLCGHNILGFDIPFLCKRFAILGIEFPHHLYFEGKKPWEIDWIIDTLATWKFNGSRGGGSLELLTAIFGIESPKDDMDGSQVHDIFWKEKERYKIISTYCEKDVLAEARLFEKLSGDKFLK